MKTDKQNRFTFEKDSEQNKYHIDSSGSQWKTLEEAAQILGYGSKKSLHVALSRGMLDDLPARKRGGKTSAWIFHVDDLEHYINEKTRKVSDYYGR